MSAFGFPIVALNSSHHGEVGDKSADSTTVDDSGGKAGEPTTVGKMDAAAIVDFPREGISASEFSRESLSPLLEVIETFLTKACANEKK